MYMWSLHQSNGPAGCMRSHGTLYQNSQTPNGLWRKHSPLQKVKRTYGQNIPDLRTASVCFIQEEPHNIPCILNRVGRIQLLLEPVL